MKKTRDRFDAELEEIHHQLLAAGAGGRLRSDAAEHKQDAEEPRTPDQRMPAAAPAPMASAFQLAGYVVATLALGRSIPGTVVLDADTEYDVGRCSQSDLDIIWAVGNNAAERGRADGAPWEPGPSITFKMEGEVIGEGASDGAERANAILDENWNDIVRVARLLTERQTLSRADIEAEVFESGALR